MVTARKEKVINKNLEEKERFLQLYLGEEEVYVQQPENCSSSDKGPGKNIFFCSSNIGPA